VMASKGKTTLRRWDVGNAAEKVFRSTDIPIFLVKAAAGFQRDQAGEERESDLIVAQRLFVCSLDCLNNEHGQVL